MTSLSTTQDIVIIGCGNVAQHIAESFRGSKKIKLVQIYNHRKSKIASAFANRFNCDLITQYKQITPDAALYIICVNDDAIFEVAKHISTLNIKGLFVHTSGSIDVSILNGISKQIGVYYPLQTFSLRSKIDWKTVPILIEANSYKSLTLLKNIACSVSKTVKKVNSSDRLKIHLAAVFASNFTNALQAVAFELIEKIPGNYQPKILWPLMKQSFFKLETMTPLQAQTGPAKRNDSQVINKHLQVLKQEKELLAVYKLLSDLIIKQQSKL